MIWHVRFKYLKYPAKPKLFQLPVICYESQASVLLQADLTMNCETRGKGFGPLTFFSEHIAEEVSYRRNVLFSHLTQLMPLHYATTYAVIQSSAY